MKTKLDRRGFLKSAAVAGTAIAVFPSIVKPASLGLDGAPPPSEKITMACIGVGSMGGGHLRSFMGQKDVQMVAVCDLRLKFRDRAKDRVDRNYDNKDCRTYKDFRELLARKDIDAVTVAVPDHWHCLIGLEAARNGKDMYYEKPLTMSIAHGKVLRETIHQYGVVFQFGTQQRSDERFRKACELVRNGRIGKLHTIMVGSHHSLTCPNQPEQPRPDPEEFDYDMWLGPAPDKPYTFHRCASRAEDTPGYWTYIYDYSLGGISGAWGIHHIDIAQWANNSDDTGPVEIVGTGKFPTDGLCDTAIQWDIEHKYPNGVTMLHMNRDVAVKRASQFNLHFGVGVLMLGNDGWIFVCRDFIKAEPASILSTEFDDGDERLPYSNNHRRNFLDCVKSRARTICPIDSAVRSDTICHIDDIVIRLGRKVRWDPRKEMFIDDRQADRMMTRPMRSPWHL